MKNSQITSANVPHYLNLLRTSIQKNQWPVASDNFKQLESVSHTFFPLLQLSEERDEINNFWHSLARLRGYIEARQKAGALAELYELKETWNDLGK